MGFDSLIFLRGGYWYPSSLNDENIHSNEGMRSWDPLVVVGLGESCWGSAGRPLITAQSCLGDDKDLIHAGLYFRCV